MCILVSFQKQCDFIYLKNFVGEKYRKFKFLLSKNAELVRVTLDIAKQAV